MTSNVSSLPEVAGDAAVYVDPHDAGAIRDALARLLESESERARLAELGPPQAAKFSWARTAEGFLNQLESVTRS